MWVRLPCEVPPLWVLFLATTFPCLVPFPTFLVFSKSRLSRNVDLALFDVRVWFFDSGFRHLNWVVPYSFQSMTKPQPVQRASLKWTLFPFWFVTLKRLVCGRAIWDGISTRCPGFRQTFQSLPRWNVFSRPLEHPSRSIFFTFLCVVSNRCPSPGPSSCLPFVNLHDDKRTPRVPWTLFDFRGLPYLYLHYNWSFTS